MKELLEHLDAFRKEIHTLADSFNKVPAGHLVWRLDNILSFYRCRCELREQLALADKKEFNTDYDLDSLHIEIDNAASDLELTPPEALEIWHLGLAQWRREMKIAIQPEDTTECLVHGCTNKKHQGSFIGDLCVPCYQMLTTGKLKHGKTFIHQMKVAHDKQLVAISEKVCELNAQM